MFICVRFPDSYRRINQSVGVCIRQTWTEFQKSYALLPEGANVGLTWLYSASFFRFFATNSKFSRNSFARSLFGCVKKSSGVASSTI